MGDFNAHHSSWGCSSRSDAGYKLLRSIEDFDLVVLNDGSPTLIHRSARKSVIDLVLASPILAPVCTNYILDDSLGSDHFPMITEVNMFPVQSKKFCYKLKLNKEKLDTLNLRLKNSAQVISCNNSMDAISQYKIFADRVQSVARSLIPSGKGVPHSKINSCRPDPSPWWNDNCDAAVKDRKRSLSKFVACPDKAYDNFKSARKKCSACLNEAKCLSWKKLVGDFDFKTSTHRI